MNRVAQASLTGILLLTILLQVALLTSAQFAAPIIQQVEAQVGHPLSCDEAYDHREIDQFFFPEHRTQSDLLYLSNLFGPFWMGALLIAVAAVFVLRRRIHRLHGLLLGGVLALLIPILIYWPTIATIACATE
ncbi:MAG: hypothetical protein K8J31_24215 [Anaerolineae bacterium]|nr:hypothetical protein [Anaerolineae bacterium]